LLLFTLPFVLDFPQEAQTFALAVIGPLTEETASSVDNCISGGTTMSRPTLDAGNGDSGGDDRECGLDWINGKEDLCENRLTL